VNSIFHSNEATLDGLQDRGWIPEKTIIIRSLRLSAPLLIFSGEGKVVETELIINYAYMMKTP